MRAPVDCRGSKRIVWWAARGHGVAADGYNSIPACDGCTCVRATPICLCGVAGVPSAPVADVNGLTVGFYLRPGQTIRYSSINHLYKKTKRFDNSELKNR